MKKNDNCRSNSKLINLVAFLIFFVKPDILTLPPILNVRSEQKKDEGDWDEGG